MADGDLHTIRVGPRTFTYKEGTEDLGEAPAFQSDIQLSKGMVDANNNFLEGILAIAVADITDPSTEMANYAGRANGALLVAYQVDVATNLWTLYTWDSADTGGADIPYVVAGSAGFWIAVGGMYKDGNLTTKGDIASSGKVDVTGNLETDGVVKVGANQVVGAQQAHIANADAHGEGDGAAAVNATAITVAAGSDTLDLADLNSDLSTLVTEVNAIVTKYNDLKDKFNALRADYNDLRGKFNTELSQQESHGLNASS